LIFGRFYRQKFLSQGRMMTKQRQLKPLLAVCVLMGLMASAPAAVAGERESLEQLRNTTMSLIDLLVQEGVLSKAKADALVKQAEAARIKAAEEDAMAKAEAVEKGAPQVAEGEKVLRVQYVPEHVKKELRDELKKEVMTQAKSEGWAYPGSIPDWLNRIEWEGDIRLRYELDTFPDSFVTGNATPLDFQTSAARNVVIQNTTEERNRFRLRARLGAKIKMSDWLDGGLRMTTGSSTDPISPNQTFESQNSKFSFDLDRAFLRAQALPWLSVSAGRIENPWFSTDLVWDPDLAFDGVAASFKPKLTEKLSGFGALGAFSLDEQESSPTNSAQDKWLFGAQAGLQWKSANDSIVKLGVALYDFQNVEGELNPLGSTAFSNTALSFRSKGNNTFSIDTLNGNDCGAAAANPCGLLSKFRELNITGQIDLATFNPVHVVLTGDYVRNIGYDESEILARTGVAAPFGKETEGYQVSLNIGMPKVARKHDWQVFGAYKHIEADALLDAFTDSDFHLGGTDTKGWMVGANYGLDKNTWLSARWFSADELTGLPLSIDVLLVDLNAKF